MSDYFVHETAVVDNGAAIGAGTKIWHFVHVSGESVIGAGCTLGQNVYVANQVKIGDGVKIQNNVSVFEGVTLDDNVFCGPSMVFTNVINPRSAIERKNEFLPTRVHRGATFGANCTIVCGVTIGMCAFIGAGAVVTKDVAPYALVVGNPGRQIGWMSAAGERLDLPLECSGKSTCAETGVEYELTDGVMREV